MKHYILILTIKPEQYIVIIKFYVNQIDKMNKK